MIGVRRAGLILTFILALGGAGPLAPTGRAAPVLQRGDGLDQPLPAANMCGAGEPGETHFTFAATGDTFPHENIQAAGEAQGYDTLFDHVRPFLQAADIAYTNFDGAMLEGSPYTGYPAFNYSPKLAAALKNAGIGVVSTANNHILDRGPEGLDATLQVLQQAGIAQHGAVPSAGAAQPRPAYLPIVLSRGGATIKLALLSFSWGTNGIPDPYGQVNLLWRSSEYGQQGGVRQSALDAIAQARREADVVIVAAHWGYEYQFYPDAGQIEGARQMAAAGADVILGAQSHTLQPVDIIDTDGRKTLVIYSLANFIASQGAFQDPYFSATSVVFYVGLIRRADGTVSVGGYRYLPIMMTDGDTRPAPIPGQGFEHLIEHVRLELRDPGGIFQVGPDPAGLNGREEVCPAVVFPEVPGLRVGGDFAQHFATLGGPAPRPPAEALAVLGRPLGSVVRELSGDCRQPVSVLYTERQRLELHPAEGWPFRVVGTQLGAAVYRQRYPAREIQRRQDLDGGAIADDRFKRFFQSYGGLPVFGYPISPALVEPDAATGQSRTVQYFERARFELVEGVAADAGLLDQVRLGALSREYAGIAAQCGLQPTAAPPLAPAPPAAPPRAEATPRPAAGPAAVEQPGAGPQIAANLPISRTGSGLGTWTPTALGGLLLLAVAYAVRVARRRRARGRARATARAWRSYLDTDQDAELLAALLSSAPPAEPHSAQTNPSTVGDLARYAAPGQGAPPADRADRDIQRL